MKYIKFIEASKHLALISINGTSGRSGNLKFLTYNQILFADFYNNKNLPIDQKVVIPIIKL